MLWWILSCLPSGGRADVCNWNTCPLLRRGPPTFSKLLFEFHQILENRVRLRVFTLVRVPGLSLPRTGLPQPQPYRIFFRGPSRHGELFSVVAERKRLSEKTVRHFFGCRFLRRGSAVDALQQGPGRRDISTVREDGAHLHLCAPGPWSACPKRHKLLSTGESSVPPGGELFSVVAERKRLSEKTVRIYMRQACDATLWMHSRGLGHRDISLENILLTDEAPEKCIRLMDFGRLWV